MPEVFWENIAGGIIIILGLHNNGKRIVGQFPLHGMHGRKNIPARNMYRYPFSRTSHIRDVRIQEELSEIHGYLSEYCADFGYSLDEIISAPFTVITPNSKNPYKQMYVTN